ncbi:MAG: 50S ribosomal protein L6 [Candidatus Aenigmatarchaeota archaeon]
MQKEIAIPAGIQARYADGILSITGPKGELKKRMESLDVQLEISEGKIILKCASERRKAKAVFGAWAAHIKNMFIGVQKGWQASMKVVYSHFPIKVSVEDKNVKIHNFMGERSPRLTRLLDGVSVDVKGADIIIKGIDKEAVGQMAANIELTARVKNRDKRIFSDGIWITQKPKPIEE